MFAYHAALAKFARAAAALGANWTLRDLRRTAAYRMARDLQPPLTDVQRVVGHAHSSATQLYLTPMPGDVLAEVLGHRPASGMPARRCRDAGVAAGPSEYRHASLGRRLRAARCGSHQP